MLARGQNEFHGGAGLSAGSAELWSPLRKSLSAEVGLRQSRIEGELEENCISFILITEELPTAFCTSVSYYSRLNDSVSYAGIEKQVYKYAYIFSREIL